MAEGAIRIVVVGFGPVSARFVEEMLPAVERGQAVLTVLGAETHDAYNRVLLAEFAVGRAERSRLDLADTERATALGVRVRRGEAAVRIDRGRQVVVTDSGEALAYDRLVLATGARANVPTLLGIDAPRAGRAEVASSAGSVDSSARPLPRGIVAFRDMRDADVVLEAVRRRQRIVVLGAGVLGMEIAVAAAEQGAAVVSVYHAETPMDRNLDRGGGLILAAAATDAGVSMVGRSRAESVVLSTDDDGATRFCALGCSDGKLIPGDLLVLSCGVSPRIELALDAGLATASGVLVDEELRSWTDPDVFAIGDCAQVAPPPADGALQPPRGAQSVAGAPSGLIGPGWRQADWLAASLSSELSAQSRPNLLGADHPNVVMLKATGIDVVAGGAIDAEPWDAWQRGAPSDAHAVQVSQWIDTARAGYLKTVSRHGVLAGFVSVGLPRAGAELSLIFERRGSVPADPSVLLRLDSVDGDPAASAALAADATVCWCNGVSVQQIADAAAGGDDTVECVGRSTRAGTGCGGCRGRIAEILATAATSPAASR